MANPTVTYTFVNGNVADASQVNQNFTDIINALTDGTKSINIDAITAAGTATFNGNTVIGNASGDTSTVTATQTFNTAPKVDTIDEKTSTNGVQLKGRTSGTDIASSYVGQVLSDSVGYNSVSAGGSSVWTQVISLAITKGVWRLSGCGNFYASANPTGVTTLGVAITVTGGASGPADIVESKNISYGNNLGLTANDTIATLPIAGFTINISSDTTYYLKCIVSFSGGTIKFGGYLEAVRIA